MRPRIGAGGVSGIDTLLSGDYIGADIGQSDTRAKQFKGLENPPPITYGEPGKRFTLHTQGLGSLDIGSPVYYRKIPVGQVVAYELDDDGKGVKIEVFVHAPNDVYVTENTRFWNASGIDLSVGANGFALKTESLSSMLAGGIAFQAPPYSPNDKPASEDHTYELFDDQQSASPRPTVKGNTWRCVLIRHCVGSRSARRWNFLGSSSAKWCRSTWTSMPKTQFPDQRRHRDLPAIARRSQHQAAQGHQP